MAFIEPIFTELTTTQYISVADSSTKLHPKQRKNLELIGEISFTSVS